MDRRRPPLVRSRMALHRRLLFDPAPLRWWAAALAAAALAGSLTAGVHARAEHARRAWGRATTVLVAARPLAPGDRLQDRVRAVRWPEALAPPDHLSRLPDGARAATAVAPGQPLVAATVDRGADPAAGRPTLALPLPDVHLAVDPGDRVDLWAAVDVLGAPADAPARRVARGARVVTVQEGSVTVAVADEEVAAVAGAAATAPVTLVGAVPAR